MVQYCRTGFDVSFAALSDATGRGVLEQLVRVDPSNTDLAEKFRMTLTGIKKHVGVLEEAEWIGRYRQLWNSRFDQLDEVVEELKRKEKWYGRKKRG